MGKEMIVKHNKIIESKYDMTVTEAKIIAKLTSMIEKDDEDFKEHVFKSRDLLEELGLGEKNYTALEDSVDRLLSRIIEIKLNTYDKKGNRDVLKTTFLSSCIYKHSTSEIILSYDPKLKPYFLQLKKNFTKYYLVNILELKSFYSIRIYELLKQYEKIRERTIDLEELKKMLGAENKSYNRYNNFKRKVLLQAKDEINEKTDLEVDFEELKTGRKVTSIRFIIKKKAIPREELEFKNYRKDKEYSQETLELFKLLPKEEQIEAHKRELARLLREHSYKYLKADIEYAKRFGVNNFFGFLKSSWERGHYSAAELEKKEKEKDLTRKREEEEKRQRELEEKIRQKAEEKALNKYEQLSNEELEDYESKYEVLPKMLKEKVSKREFIIGALEEEVEKELRELLSGI